MAALPSYKQLEFNVKWSFKKFYSVLLLTVELMLFSKEKAFKLQREPCMTHDNLL